jgi:NNP family nitrate/nitrite transporter-like MFS transporter
VFGVLCGSGIAVFSVGIPSVSYWFPQRRQGRALALYAGLGNLAPGLFALILPGLVTALGFTASYILWLALLVFLLFFFLINMRDAPYFQYQQMGIQVDPDALLQDCGQELMPSGHALDSIKKAAADWRTWILTFFYFVSFGGFIALTVWLPTYWAEFYATGLVAAGLLTALYSLSSSLLRVAGGYASDMLGGEAVVLVSFAAVVLGALLMVMADAAFGIAVTGQMILALGMGFANAAVFKLVPKYSPRAVGGAAGIVGGLGAFGGFVIPPLMGFFVKIYGASGYARGFIVFLALAVMCLGAFFILNRYAPFQAVAAQTGKV